jgi:hypothetical protein
MPIVGSEASDILVANVRVVHSLDNNLCLVLHKISACENNDSIL